MNINITARNFKISSDFSEQINKRINKLLKYDKYIYSAEVILSKESRAEKVELFISSKKCKYITKSVSSIFEKTLSRAIQNISCQIRRKH